MSAEQGTKRPATITKLSFRVSPPRKVRSRDEILLADRLDLEMLSWFILQVTAGAEAKVLTQLRAMGFGTCLPMRRVYQK